MKKPIVFLLMICCFTLNAWAFSPFVVKSIRITGLQRITRDTVLSYLPVKAGQRISTDDSHEIIEELYNTGFFDVVQLAQDGQTLIVHVKERPVIGSITITGNKDIPTNKLMSGLKGMGIAEGHVFNRALLTQVKGGLIEQYYSVGKYNATVDVQVHDESRNRVAVTIKISEGAVAKIRSIKIIGNHVFKEKDLLKLFKLTTPTLFSFLSHSDQYSKEMFSASIEALRSYYLDRGYIRFEIVSTEVTLTPDKKSVYIIVRIKEGPQFTFRGFKLEGDFVLPEAELNHLVEIKAGDVFSSKKVVTSTTAIGNKLGSLGYAYPRIHAEPEINDQTRKVFITISIHPDKRIYVRRINFRGNYKTADNVLRRELRQYEGGLVNTDALRKSVRRLNLVGYLKDVKLGVNRVTGKSDQVDITYHVKENPSNKAIFGVGYSSLDGILVNANLTQNNFLGTGNKLSFNFQNTSSQRDYAINYNNPYYTISGISRGFDLYLTQTDPSRINLSDYFLDKIGAVLHYSFPLSENKKFNLGFGLQNTILRRGSTSGGKLLSTQLITFINKKGSHFHQALFSAGWVSNELDRAIFPTRGFYQSLGFMVSLPVDTACSLEYYKSSYTARWYRPLPYSFILYWRGMLGYGHGYGSTKALPFFDNFYAGGIDSVAAYDGNTLGPRDSNGDPLGGNAVVTTRFGLIFPNLFHTDNIRTIAFVDAGNVFQTSSNYGLKPPTSTIPKANRNPRGGVRFSAGLALEWQTPIGPLELSAAIPINKDHRDKDRPIQFNIGANF